VSALIDSLVTQSAVNIANPDKGRITPSDWLIFYNAVARDIGARLYAVRYVSVFDWQIDSDYDYPDEMTRMIALWATDTPSDELSWSKLDELREDQFYDRVNRRYPTGTTPTHYLPQATIMRVVPRPETVIVAGAKLEYWGLPDEIASTSGTTMQFPDFMREWVVEGMTIHALRTLKEIVEARERYEIWAGRESEYATRLTDRSDDRRAAMVPRSRKRGTSGMT
jgi:hypothetical protein